MSTWLISRVLESCERCRVLVDVLDPEHVFAGIVVLSNLDADAAVVAVVDAIVVGVLAVGGMVVVLVVFVRG